MLEKNSKAIGLKFKHCTEGYHLEIMTAHLYV